MKKHFKYASLLLALAIPMPIMVSCGDDDPVTPEAGTDPITPNTPDKGEAMSAAKQKEYLESVALEFMDLMPSSDFRDIADLGQYISDTYADDYDWDAVEDWGKDLFDASKEALGIQTSETETHKWGDYTYKYNYFYTHYKAVILASNFTGHFTARNGRWFLSKADDLQFIFKDMSGKECIVKLETSGNVKKVYAFNDDDWQDYDWNWSDDNKNYVSNDYYDRIQYTIGVPETIVVTLTQGGSQVVKTTINVDMSNLTDERFDISKNSLSLTAVTEINNGYKFDVSQMAYNANSKASAIYTMSKNGRILISAAISSDISGIPSCNVDAFTSDDMDDYDTDDVNAKNAFVKLDILGKVQMQGVLSDVRKFADYLNKADDNDRNEATFKSYINQANDLTDVNLFYDGKSTKQATVKLEAFMEETWNGQTWWTTEPVIYFNDGSSYSTFEAFFNETDFKKVIDAFKALSDKYADLIDEHVDW